MGDTDICENADVRPGNFRKARHLFEAADPHLKNRDFMFLTEVENSKRKPNLIVKVSFCFQNRIFL